MAFIGTFSILQSSTYIGPPYTKNLTDKVRETPTYWGKGTQVEDVTNTRKLEPYNFLFTLVRTIISTLKVRKFRPSGQETLFHFPGQYPISFFILHNRKEKCPVSVVSKGSGATTLGIKCQSQISRHCLRPGICPFLSLSCFGFKTEMSTCQGHKNFFLLQCSSWNALPNGWPSRREENNIFCSVQAPPSRRTTGVISSAE